MFNDLTKESSVTVTGTVRKRNEEDYNDKIAINMKDEGKREVIKNIEKSFSQDRIKVSEVLGFNNIEYTIKNVKD